MRIKSRISLTWLAAAALAIASPVTHSARAVATDASTATLLGSQLPAGVTLKQATIDQTGDALYAAASQRPDLATGLLKVAILAKRPPPHHGHIPCPDLIKLIKRTAAAVPDQARQLVELAISLEPECTDELTDLLKDPSWILGPNGNSPAFGFGVGLGSDFPGSPGFTGSPPGGTIALPPISTQPAVTPE